MRTLVLLGLLASSAFAAAQVVQAPSSDGKAHTQLQGIDIPSIPNAPFSARVLVRWSQPLASGGAIVRKYYTQVARDSKGRVRREVRGFVPGDSGAEPPLRSFYINDPVSSMHINCTVATKRCSVTDFHPRTLLTQASAGANLSRDNLGQKVIGSARVTGTRETVTSPVGGSDQPLTTTTELWYSKGLQMNLSVVRNDPQFGQQTFTVADLVRSDPAAKWLSIPAGYQIVDSRPKPGN